MKLVRRCGSLGLLGVLLLGLLAIGASWNSIARASADDSVPAKNGQGGKDPKSDEHGTGEKKADEHSESHIFDWAAEQAIWTIVVFIVLLIVLRRYAWGPILEGLRKREEHIRLAVEEAKLARLETQKAQDHFKEEMARAYAEIPKVMEQARRDAAKLQEEMKTKAAGEIQADRDRLRREIETARDQALQELWNQTATLATLISAKAIGRSLNIEDHRRLTEEALAEVKGAGSQWKTELRQFGQEWTRKGGGSE
jgi:F-type H+-transporting ATPase subunit b